MKYLVTGSSGHLAEALIRTLQMRGADFNSIDIKPSDFTTHQGSITDQNLVQQVMKGVDVVFHTATLHKPHIITHSRQDFIDVNVTGTQTLLDAAIKAGVKAFIFTSTTSTFGLAMRPKPDGPAIWVDESLKPIVKNIYGGTKLAAETLCELAHNETGLNVIVLRVSRFFPEQDDNKNIRDRFEASNAMANEYLNRRADIDDMVSACFCAAERAENIGFGRYIISATSPFQHNDVMRLSKDAPSVIAQYLDVKPIYDQLEWQLPPTLDRVYDNKRARLELGWQPKADFMTIIRRMATTGQVLSELAQAVGTKGYHDQRFDCDGPYPV